MKKLIAIFLLFSCFGTFAQSEFELVKEIKHTYSQFSTDPFGNIYFITNSELIKTDFRTNQKFNYSNNLFGKITSIDLSDPLRILLYNKDFNKISFLDNRLAEITSTVSINDLGYYNVAAVCQSNSGGFWIFDQNLNELIYFNKNLEQQKKSSQVSSLFDPEKEISEIFMLEKNDYIYLGIKDQGVLLFDVYGTYIKTFPIADIEDFQVLNSKIVYYANSKLILYNTLNFTAEVLDLPIEKALDVRIEQNKLFILTKDKVVVYRLTIKK